MASLDDRLSAEFDTPDARAALAAAHEDQDLLVALITLRQMAGLTIEGMAARTAMSENEVRAFERLGADPTLSTIRRYARAVGVVVRHECDGLPSQEDPA